MYAHAAAQLTSLFVRGDGGYLGTKCVCVSAKCALSIAFFWDNAFSCIGESAVCPELAQQAIECFTDHPSPRGALPGTLCDTNRAGEGQAPIMTWAAWTVYERTRDRTWLKGVYPSLAGNNRFWFKYHCSERGLCQFFNAGQIADDDARFDPIQAGSANQDLSGLESPDLNAYLVMDLKCLAKMAEALGLNTEAAGWKRQADELGRRIIEMMYFPEDALFFDVATGTRRKFTGAKGPNMFLPLWAGVPLPRENIKEIVERHMLNPDEFYREYPFPSLSYDHPRYDPTG
jgi:putative isomerase